MKKSASTFKSKNTTIICAFEGNILARIIGLPCIYLEYESISVNTGLKSRHWLCNPLWASDSLSQAWLPLIMEMYFGFPKCTCDYDLSL